MDRVVKVLMAWVGGRIGGGLGIGTGLGLVLILLPFCFAQPEIVWNSTYVDVQLVGAGGGSLWQTICKDNIPLLEQSICWSPDGGYVEVGAKTQYDYRDSPSDLYVLRSDSEGKPLWQKTYGGALSDESARAVTQSGDGGFILAGYKMPGPLGGWENVYLLKIDEEGNLTWERFYVWDSSGVNRATSIARAEDGFLVVGYTSPSGLQDVYVVRVNSSGGMLWERTYGGNKSEEADFVIQSGDGGFIIVGSTESFGVPLPGVLPLRGRENVYILKIDGEGNKVWEKGYGTSGFTIARSKVVPSRDGGFVVVGRMYGGTEANAYVLKIDSAGNRVWQIEYTGQDCFAYGVVCNDVGGYWVVGYEQQYLSCDGSVLFKVADEPLTPIPEASVSLAGLLVVASLAVVAGHSKSL